MNETWKKIRAIIAFGLFCGILVGLATKEPTLGALGGIIGAVIYGGLSWDIDDDTPDYF